jgi:MFS family permease
MSSQIGYLALLRRNKNFRRLWYGQIVSQLGDWFDSIALYAILYSLTGSGQAVGALLVAQNLPSALVSLWAGVLIDRLPRRAVLIATDIGRGLLVLAFLFVRDPSQIWIIYLVTVLKNVLTTFFEPARSAITPSVTSREELVAANGIAGITWSAMLALGAAAGGLVVGFLGTEAAFVIDSASFFLSAVLILGVRVREDVRRPTQHRSGWSDMRDGFAYLSRHRDVAIYTLTKGLWSLGAGVMVLLTIFGRENFPLGKEGALSMGLLYAARGVGAGIGPLLAQRLGGDTAAFFRRALGPAFVLCGLGYVLAGVSPLLLLAMLAVMTAHMGGSIQWVFSTTLIQIAAPREVLGRIFAVEFACMTLASAASSYGFGVLHDAGWSAFDLSLLAAALFTLPGLALFALLRRPPVAEPSVATD